MAQKLAGVRRLAATHRPAVEVLVKGVGLCLGGKAQQHQAHAAAPLAPHQPHLPDLMGVGGGGWVGVGGWGRGKTFMT